MTALTDPKGVLFELIDESKTGMTLEEAYAFLAGADRSTSTLPPIVVAAAEVHTGAMIALVPTDADSKRLALKDFEPPDQLHLTLVYLGDAADISETARESIITAVKRYAQSSITSKAFAVNVFNPTDDEPALVLGVGNEGGPALEELRSNIFSSVRGISGFTLAENHSPWIPHVTLAYAKVVTRSLLGEAISRVGPITFDRIRVAFGGENTDIPLDLEDEVEEAMTAAANLAAFHLGDQHNQQTHAGDRVMGSLKLGKRVKSLESALSANVKRLATNITHRDKNGTWSPERDAIHREIVRDFYARAKDVPNEGRAILVGGNAGAGKSTVLQEQAKIDLGRFLKIDPDEVKEELAKRGLIPELPDGDFSPMERSTLVHRESVRIADMLADRAFRDRKNIIWDGTMADSSLVFSRINRMSDSGYRRIDAVFVDVSDQTSRARVADRYRRGLYDWVRGKGQGSRFVPTAIQNAMKSSDTRYGFNKLRKAGMFNNWVVYNNDVDGQPAKLVARDGAV